MGPADSSLWACDLNLNPYVAATRLRGKGSGMNDNRLPSRRDFVGIMGTATLAAGAVTGKAGAQTERDAGPNPVAGGMCLITVTGQGGQTSTAQVLVTF